MTKQELADGIRFAGERAAAATGYASNWDRQLGNEWTTRDAFCHVAASGGLLEQFFPMIASGAVADMPVADVAAMNAEGIGSLADQSPEQLAGMIVDGHNASAAFVETLDDDALAQPVRLGGYQMPMADVIAQVWIHHSIAHAYEGSARWPLA